VIQEVLPVLYAGNGGAAQLSYDESQVETGVAYYLLTNGTLELLLVDVTVATGAEFFQATTDALSIGSTGVPRLVVADQVMIGSTDIPDRFPVLIESGLAGEGIDWPDLPGIREIVGSFPTVVTTTTTTVATGSTAAGEIAPSTTIAPTTTDPAPVATLPTTTNETVGERFGRDPLANSVAVVVLIGLLGSLVVVGRFGPGGSSRRSAVIPLLVVLGIVIAGYLTYVEVGSVEAVCGPVGDCNAVQQSDYARVAGIPIGLIGLGGYLVVGALWLMQRSGDQRRSDLAWLGMALIAIGGVAFSAWLTFLEPFVIGATCVWCLGSAVVICALLWLTVPPAREAWRRLAPISAPE
jgi:uncharacterized membrane protein